MKTESSKKEIPKILIVDDLSINVGILENIMQAEGYEALCALSVQEALDIMNETMPQLILSDLSMPGMSGLEFCKLLKSNPRTRNIPFVFITVTNSREEKKEAFLAGAVDFIPKPFDPTEVVMRVNNQLNSYRIRQEMEDYNRMIHKMMSEQKRHIESETENVLLALVNVVEKRSGNLGNHLDRVAYNCRILAQSVQLIPKYENSVTDEFIEIIGTASKFHNIGNIAVRDTPPLNGFSEEEKKERIRRHTEEGAKILEEISSAGSSIKFLNMAIIIARYQHAHWDGTGCPENIKGDEIPLAARIMAVVNDFDTLLWNQNDEQENSLEESVRIINERSGKLYDPRIVQVFNKVLKQLKTEGQAI